MSIVSEIIDSWGLVEKLLSRFRKKPLAEVLKRQPDTGGLKGLLPYVYHPLYLGRESVEQFNQDDQQKPLEFPFVGWHEEGRVVGQEYFQQQPEDKIFKDWVHRPGLYLILGEPGGGKTTLLSEWYRRAKQMTSLVTNTVWFALSETNVGDVSALTTLSSRHPVILLDSWDEAKIKVQHALKTILPNLPGVVIISCRSALYHAEFQGQLATLTPYYVMGLPPSDQQRFLESLSEVWRESYHGYLLEHRHVDDNWAAQLCDAIQSHPCIRSISGSPLLLTLLAYLYPPNKLRTSTLPSNKLAFYDEAFAWLCRNRIGKDMSDAKIGALVVFLELLVYQVGFDKPVTAEELQTCFRDERVQRVVNEVANTMSLDDIDRSLQQAGILKKPILKKDYQFLHQSFHEWLMAKVLYKIHGLVKAVEKYWQDYRYMNTLAMMWSLAETEERSKATQRLVDLGCQIIPHVDPSNDCRASGLRTAIHLWYYSGLPMDETSLMYLMDALQVSIDRKHGVANDKATHGRVLERLAIDDDADVRWRVARNSATPVEVLESIATDNSMHVRSSVVWNTNTQGALLVRLATDEQDDVRRAVALNTKTPVAVLERMATDDVVEIRGAVARNASIPVALLERLATDEIWAVRSDVATNANTPASLLERLATDDDDVVRRRVAQNVVTPVEVLERLAVDKSWSVRRGVAVNAAAPVHVLERLALDNNHHVRWYVTENATTPVSLLERLASDDDENVRKGVAMNGNTPFVILERLAMDQSDVVRSYVAKNRNTPNAVLERLATDDNEDILEQVAANISTPLAILARLATEKNVRIRRAVAANTNTPVAVLESLATDKDQYVRLRVALNSKACLEWFVARTGIAQLP